MRIILLAAVLCLYFNQNSFAQKKPLDHSVYDGWQNVDEKLISNDGQWIVYTVNVQEGDNDLFIRSAKGTYYKQIPRGDAAVITDDSRYVICYIRPAFAATRQARIRKAKPEDMPKDSIAIVELGRDEVVKIPAVKNFRLPGRSGKWLAYLLEPKPAAQRAAGDNRKTVDSLQRVIDSLQQVISTIPRRTPSVKDGLDADGDETPVSNRSVPSTLVLRDLSTGKEKKYYPVSDYVFSEKGRKLLIELSRDPKDTSALAGVLLLDLVSGLTDTISRGGNDFRHFSFSEDESQLVFVAERNAKPKELQKYYKLWYHRDGMDTAIAIVDKNAVGMQLGMTVSEYGRPQFSRSGKRILFGTAPIQAPKDTSLVDIDLVKVDIWHYNDDYLQTQQLVRQQRDSVDTYLAVYSPEDGTVIQLGSPDIPVIYPSDEGDGNLFAGVSDRGHRIETQWTGSSRKTIYAIDPRDGRAKLIRKDGQVVISSQYVSPSGKYIMWFDLDQKHYFAYDGDTTRKVSARIRESLVEEDNDVPDYARPYGIMRWMKDESVLIYDRYGAWKVDPAHPEAAAHLFDGRKTRTRYRYVQLDREERYAGEKQPIVLRSFSDITRFSGFGELIPAGDKYAYVPVSADSALMTGSIVKARDSRDYLFTKETYTRSPDLYHTSLTPLVNTDPSKFTVTVSKVTAINPQQKNYNWGTAELYKWTAFNNKSAEGILYKPEDFNPAKKYPVILYFYEKLTDGLYQYQAPAPTPSRLNISFFVSRGYIVLAPDINYTVGHPAKSAYDYIVSGAKDLATQPWVDGKNMAIQGQSWGGIQVAQLITMTDIFKAAWAGAPVANMTSAYGGIRWESGMNRQFQYEKTQSRIGATLWEKPELYIENSPLFHLPKVKTPLVIMANDADGAVPWYQGIELYTGLRRLGKKVWMLNYNGEAHNLVQRKNRKDIQIRQQQYFDWLLKGARPAPWITDGVPASRKGRDWGL